MADNKSSKNEVKSQYALSELQIDIHKNNPKSYEERANQLQQDYYTKACGCSVKEQKDNLFDYKSQINNRANSNK